VIITFKIKKRVILRTFAIINLIVALIVSFVPITYYILEILSDEFLENALYGE
jgi:hypothetical protein